MQQVVTVLFALFVGGSGLVTIFSPGLLPGLYGVGPDEIEGHPALLNAFISAFNNLQVRNLVLAIAMVAAAFVDARPEAREGAVRLAIELGDGVSAIATGNLWQILNPVFPSFLLVDVAVLGLSLRRRAPSLPEDASATRDGLAP